MNSLILFGSVIAIAFLLAAILMPLEVSWGFEPKQKICFDNLSNYFKYRTEHDNDSGFIAGYPCPDFNASSELQEQLK